MSSLLYCKLNISDMKKVCLIAVAFSLLIACQSNKNETPATRQTELQPATVDSHNAQNSLDYTGTYSGLLPAASGPGMRVTITLNDTAFHQTINYIDHDSIFETFGSYAWDSGNIITLHGVDKPNQYLVGENRLYHLDVDGNRITGDLADQYILNKQ